MEQSKPDIAPFNLYFTVDEKLIEKIFATIKAIQEEKKRGAYIFDI